MKKEFLTKLFISFMLLNVLSMSIVPFNLQNKIYANVVESEESEADIDPGTIAALVGAGATIVKFLFCPTTPRNVCKSGTCQSGACISLRTPCVGSGSCGSSSSSENPA